MCKLFVLSPANLDGVRGRRLGARNARFPAAEKLRRGEVEIGEAFSYISSLYFRAKLLYAERFAQPVTGTGELPPALVVATGFGLVAADWPVDRKRLARLRRIPVDPSRPSYRKPIEADASRLAERLPEEGVVVFLGSLAPKKYLDVLLPSLAGHLLVPEVFIGRGQMQRGSLLLDSVKNDSELTYVPAVPNER